MTGRKTALKAKSHPDVEFHILGPAGEDLYFRDFDEAAAAGFRDAMATGKWKNLNVLVHSEEGARWWGGDEAAERYLSDPEASVFERFVFQVRSQGTIP